VRVTRQSIVEYAEAVRSRYVRAGREAKAKILDEFVEATDLHRKSAIRLLNRTGRLGEGKKRGRPRLYGAAVVDAVKIVWEASDCLCSRRLQPFVPELTQVLEARGELKVTEETRRQLCRLSASTIDRMTRRWRLGRIRRGMSTTKPGTLLKEAIPIKTFSEWEDTRPGFVRADLVAHCGDSAEGFYLTTLSIVDVATGWHEPMAVWGKGQDRVGGAIQHIRERLPMAMLGLDSDNGGEFINRNLLSYCARNRITFTRSRSYKKNDSCHIEQKNWSIIRRTVGYQRFSSKAAYEILGELYMVLRLYVNFFQPVLKLISKSRHGARVHKVYDTAQTPYQRILTSGVLTQERNQQLANIYQALNPMALLRQIRQTQERLWVLGDRESPLQENKTR
jgi:hypothetical protein